MSLNKKIQELNEDYTRKLEQLNSLKQTIKKYQRMTEITFPELLDKLSHIRKVKTWVGQGFDLRVYTGAYQYILGGDGRSAPYDETRRGQICEVRSEYYLSADQKKVVKEYLISIGNIDHLRFVE